MPKLMIEKLPPYDGSYDLEISSFTGRELHLIKQISGVRAGEMLDALQAGDYDLVVAITVIVLQRAGTTVDPDTIMDAEVGAITMKMDDPAEAEKRPPTSPPPSGNENSNGGPADRSDGSEISGPPSSDDGDQPPSHLRLTGSPSSGNSESVPVTGQAASAT